MAPATLFPNVESGARTLGTRQHVQVHRHDLLSIMDSPTRPTSRVCFDSTIGLRRHWLAKIQIPFRFKQTRQSTPVCQQILDGGAFFLRGDRLARGSAPKRRAAAVALLKKSN